MKHLIAIYLDGEATEQFVPDLPVVDDEVMTFEERDRAYNEALREQLASGVAGFIGQHYGTEVFKGTITVTWTPDGAGPVVLET